MRIFRTSALAVALVLASATATVSQSANKEIQRCESGLQRNINVCGNMHNSATSGYDRCVNTAQMTFTTCIEDAVRRMQTRSED